MAAKGRSLEDRAWRRYRDEMARNHDAIALGCMFRRPIGLGQRPERYIVRRRKSLQRIAGTGQYQHAAVP